MPGTGVVVLSEASPVGSPVGEDAGGAEAVWVWVSVGVEMVDNVDFGVDLGVGFGLEFFLGVGFGRKRRRVVAGSLNTTILLGLLGMSGRGS